MKLQILSDLHLEHGVFDVMKNPAADVIVAAGDIHKGIRGVEWLQEFAGDTPVVYVLGNHEFYGNNFPGLYTKVQLQTLGTNVHMLQNSSVNILGYTFYGCTLWTNMLYSDQGNDFGTNCYNACQSMNDYKKIRKSNGYQRIIPANTVFAHNVSLTSLLQDTQTVDKDKLIIVTHHLPSQHSLDPLVQEKHLDCAYASDLSRTIELVAPKMWIHGHTHCSNDYMLSNTRIVSNPHGYLGDPPPLGNPNFNINLIEI